MSNWTKSAIIFGGIILFFLLYALSSVLTPLLISAILAYLGNPLVNKLMRFRIPRLISVIIIFMILLLIVAIIFLILIPLIQRQIIELIEIMPEIMSWLQTRMTQLTDYFYLQGLDLESLKQALTTNLKANVVAVWVGKNVLASGLAIVGWLINLVLIPVVTFYLLRDWNTLIKNIQNSLPRSIEPTVTRLAKECDEVLGAFLRGQFLVMISLGIIYAIGLTVIGLKVGVIIGLIAGLVSIVPYLGFIIGLISALVASLVQYGTLASVISVIVIFLIGQLLEGTILTPLLVGHRVGLHPVAIIFAILAGGSLFGFFGVLLAVPVASMIMVLIRYLSEKYHKSYLYRTK